MNNQQAEEEREGIYKRFMAGRDKVISKTVLRLRARERRERKKKERKVKEIVQRSPVFSGERFPSEELE